MYLNGNLTETDVKKTNVCKMLVLETDISKRHCFNGIIGKINIFHRILNLTEVCALHELCNIEKPKVKIEAEEEQEKKPKCKFIPAGDTKAKCSEICMSKDNCDEVVCKIYVIIVQILNIVLGLNHLLKRLVLLYHMVHQK